MDFTSKVYTVTQLNREIKDLLEEVYPEIWIEGEVSNFKTYTSGHMYFSLKDADSQISAVVFKGINRNFRFQLRDGLKIIVRGRVTSYPKRGDYQVIISMIEPAGKGALHLAFEQLKIKLGNEGLFAVSRKKIIPQFPKKIGVVTSPDGAAIRDILTVINRRFADVEIMIYPVRVQGDEAKEDIRTAIDYLNVHHPDIDVMLVGRGGGSLEDLWAFNEEIVARAIASSKIPVISCIGHEIDYTIADFVADLRAPTPSAAAELVVRSKIEVIEKIRSLRQYIVNHIQFEVSGLIEKVKYLSQSRVLRDPIAYYDERFQNIDEFHKSIVQSVYRKIDSIETKYIHLTEKLNILSPLSIMGHGYSICQKYPENEIVKESSQLELNDRFKVKFLVGEIIGKVEKKSSKLLF